MTNEIEVIKFIKKITWKILVWIMFDPKSDNRNKFKDFIK